MFRLIWIGSFLVLVLTGCGQDTQAGNSAPAEKVVRVAVRSIALETLEETFTLPGGLEAWEDLTLAAELAGTVRWIGPREGDRVRRGDPLLRIDPETVEANLARAAADLDLQEKNLARMRQLLAQKFVSDQEFDRARQAHEVAVADLRRARAAREKSTLAAPTDGVLDRLAVDRGEYVAEGAPVAVIVQVDRLKALVEVPEKDVPFLRVGQRVQVIPAAISGQGEVRTGEILHLAYKADPATRTYLAKIAMDNEDGALRPGMITRVVFQRRQLADVIAIPLYAVIQGGGGQAVFVDEGGTARLRPVKTGAVIGDRVVIEEGLVPGDRLLVQGQQLVTDGTRIQPQESDISNHVSGKPGSES